jgi:glutaredoxin
MKKENLITIGVVILVLVVAAYLIQNKPAEQASAELTKCIGQNSLLYTQTGCSHCKDQEDLFGNNIQSLNIIDCVQDGNLQKCIDAKITGTPTWIIKNQSYVGVQTIAKLKELTGC